MRSRSVGVNGASNTSCPFVVEPHDTAVLVVHHREHADPAAEAAHGLDERSSPERAVLVLEGRRERHGILDRRRLDHEAAVLVTLVGHRVRADRIDHVRILGLVEQAVDEAHRMEAEMAADEAAGRAVRQPRPQEQLRGVQRPGRDDDRARIDPPRCSVVGRRTRRPSPRRPRSAPARRAPRRAARACPPPTRRGCRC